VIRPSTSTPVGPRPARPSARGFAVPVVVFMLASVMLLMATGYEMIRVIGDVRGAARDGIMAEKAAEAAIERFMGDRVGVPPDSEVVQLSAETRVRVRSRRLSRVAGHRTSYLLTGAAEQGATFPAKRTVREFAVLEPPVEATAVLMVVSGSLVVDRFAAVSGIDAAAGGACSVGSGNIGGALAVGTVSVTSGSPITGSPQTTTPSSRAAAISLIGAKWDYILGPELPVQYTTPTAWPPFASLHADTFPLIRITGDFAPTSAHNGRGALIVTGVFRPGSNFSWNGVILAGALETNASSPVWTLRGLIAAGFDPTAGAVSVPANVTMQYNRCHVMRAFAKMSHLERVSGTTWTAR
jgi:hypothetical protein